MYVSAALPPGRNPVARAIARRAEAAKLSEIDRLEAVKGELLRECYGLIGGFAGDGLFDGGGVGGYGPDGFAGPGSFRPLVGRQGRKDGGNWPLVRTETDLDVMRTAARWLCDTNGYAIGFRGHLTHFTVGKGYTWSAVLRGAASGAVSTGVADRDDDGTPDADPDVEAAQKILDDWRAAEHWGATNAQPDPHAHPDDPVRVRGNREVEAFQRAVTDGEANARLFLGGRGELPTMRLVEPELIGSPDGSTAGPAAWGKGTVGRDAETLARVWVWDDFERTRGDWVAARRIVTHKRNVVASVKRGVSDFLPVGEQLELCLKLGRNMGTVACIVAAIAYIRQHPVGTTELQVTQMIDKDADYDEVRRAVGRLTGGRETLTKTKVSVPGEVVDVNNGQQWVAPPLVAGVPGFVQVQQAMLRAIGVRWCAPEYFSGDSSNSNFASTLVSGSPFVKAVEAAQEDWAGFEAELACRVLEFARASGLIRPDQLARVEVQVTPPAVALANKLEETQIYEIQCRNKVLSPQTWAVKADLDPGQEFANIKAFQQEFPDPTGGPTPGLFGDDDPGGGGDDFGPVPEGVREDRQGLVKKTITDKNGNRSTHWVRPDEAAVSAAGGNDAKAERGLFGKARDLGSKLLNTKVGRALAAVEHKLSIAAHKTRDIAEQAALRRGHTPEQAARLKRTLAVADFVGGYVTGGVAAATVSPLAGKAAAFAPSVSAVYLAYSTARDPVATWRAAKAVVAASSLNPRAAARDIGAAYAGKAHEAVAPDWLDTLADLLAGDDADWRQAVFLAALRAGHAAETAVRIAADADPRVTEGVKTGVDSAGHKWKTLDGKRVPVGDGGGEPAGKRGGSKKAPPGEPARELSALRAQLEGGQFGSLGDLRVAADAANARVTAGGHPPLFAHSSQYPANWYHQLAERLGLTHSWGPGYAVGDLIEAGRKRRAELARQEAMKPLDAAGPPAKRDVTLGPAKLPKSNADILVAAAVDEAMADAAVVKLFGGDTGDAYTALTHAVGMPDDAELTLTHVGAYDTKFTDDRPMTAAGVRVEVTHPKLGRVSRFVGVDANGKRFIRNEILEVKPKHQGEGLGADIFARQAESAAEHGFDYIQTHAAGGPGQEMNGYYTWPRFGYDMALDDPHGVGRGDEPVFAEAKARFPDANTIQDVFRTPEGRQWWKDNGTDLHNARFALTPGSRSLAVLSAYLTERASRATTPRSPGTKKTR